MEKLTSEAQFNEVISSSKPTIGVFKAVWCKDCHFIDMTRILFLSACSPTAARRRRCSA